MYQLGHYGAALLSYAPLGFLVLVAGFPQLAIVGGACTLALATLPDVDHRIPGCPHRGPTHTVWFALLVGLALGGGGVALAVVTDGSGVAASESGTALFLGLFGFAVGTLAILSHLGADVITPSGIRPFAPLRDDHYTYDIVRAKNPIANAVLFALGVAATGGALWAGALVAGGI